MSAPAIHRADLLKALAALPAADWPAAIASLGFEPRPAAPDQPTHEGTAPAAAPAPSAAPAPAPAPSASHPFLRITHQRRLSADERPTGPPAWLTGAEPWHSLDDGDPAPRPLPQPLAPRARQARALRQTLALPAGAGRQAPLDLAALCRLLAQCRLPARLPRQTLPRWPGRLWLVLDLSPALAPFHAEFARWSRRLDEALGRRVRRVVTANGDPDALRPVGGAPGPWRPDDGTPLVVLSDAGLYDPVGPRHRRWLALARRCAEAGTRPLLLAPCPRRLCTGPMVRAFRCIPLDWQAPLHPVRARPASAPADGDDPATRHLLAALAPGARTEAALLQALRLLLAAHWRGQPGPAPDIGTEYLAWNHPAVVQDGLACALRAAQRGPWEQAFRADLDRPLREAIIDQRQALNAGCSPQVRLEEALAAAQLTGAAPDPAAIDAARRWAATLYRSDAPWLRHPLIEAVAGLGRRRPALLDTGAAAGQGLAVAWVIARREQQGAVGALPPGLDPDAVAWLLADSGAERPVQLARVGMTLGLFPAADPQPACPLATLSTDLGHWALRALGDDAAGSRLARVGEALPLDGPGPWRVGIGPWRLDLDAIPAPPWSAGIGQDPSGLFADLPDGRRLYWLPAGSLAVDGAGADLELAAGAWWDADEYRAWLAADRRLTRPDWASAHGVDDYGRWAAFQVKGVVQRMRWLPPGEFLMGSPVDEMERFDDETQHPVVLTQGLWLADTTCTQALWKAVLSESPSSFKGAERPVEQVSWEDITARFLPALNALVPGLAARLPTEAEWEYGCRAGTPTPFWFGETINTDQVNYDGNRPYAGGEKGRYRQETVPVKALPANGWGLYQTHGNVLEWCADWLDAYPTTTVVDPAGPPEGRNRVLRGGNWSANARWCRSAARGGLGPGNRDHNIGFRLARGPSPRQDRQGGVGEAGEAAGVGAPAATPAAPAPGPQKGLRQRLSNLINRLKN